MEVVMQQIMIDYKSKEPYYMQIYTYYKKEILKRELKKGEKLPSIRGLSMDIKVSKTTVESAYNQLVIEGYVHNIPKKGYFIVELKEYSFPQVEDKKIFIKENKEIKHINNGVDTRSFDIKLWKKLYSSILEEKNQELFTVGDPHGEFMLRKEISDFVQKTRGVQCKSDQVVIGAGIQYLLGILCSLIKDKYDKVAFEYPGFDQAKNIFEDYNMDMISIPVYKEGIDIRTLKKSSAKLVYLSPSHQYPTGSVMPIDKRIEILNWAQKNKAIIIEDDYDCLIRYESRPIPALQGLDKAGNVIYLGSFSKILLPSIRISYMILPRDILEVFNKRKKRYAQTASKMEQFTLAQFMQEGHLEKHLRKINKLYRQKNESIVDFIESQAKNKIKILGHDSGLHMMFYVDSSKSNTEILKQANKNNIYIEMVESDKKGLKLAVFPYSGIAQEQIKDLLSILIKKVF